MKKVFVALMLLCALFLVACSSNVAKENEAPSAIILNSSIENGVASFIVKSNNSNNLTASLVEDNEEIQNQSIEKDKTVNVDFSGLRNKTQYTINIVDSEKGILTSQNFSTGIWEYSTPKVIIPSEAVTTNDGVVTVSANKEDIDNTIEELRVLLKIGTKTIQQKVLTIEEINSNNISASFSNLSANKKYEVNFVATYNLGLKGEVRNEVLGAVSFVTEAALNSPIIENLSLTADSTDGYEVNEIIDAELQFTNTSNSKVTGILVNGKRINSFELDGNKLKFKVPAEWRLSVEGIFYNDGYEEVIRPITEKSEDTNTTLDISINLEEDEEGYKLIKNKLELDAVNQDLAGKYRLANDIQLGLGQEFIPIGHQKQEPFTGTFDGNNNSIINLQFKAVSSYVGLFGRAENATFKNLKLDMANKLQYSFGSIVRYGGLVGENNGGLIDNVDVIGESIYIRSYDTAFASNFYIGGLVGLQTSGTIQNTSTQVFHSSVMGMARYMGGLVGFAKGTIIDNTDANVLLEANFVSNTTYIGGVVGYSESIINSVSETRLEIRNSKVQIDKIKQLLTSRIGGVSGYLGANATIENSNVTIEEVQVPTSMYSSILGGVTAESYGTINNSLVNANFKTNFYQRSHRIGGITAILQTEISNNLNDSFEQAKISGGYVNLNLIQSGGEVIIGGAAGQNIDGYIEKVNSNLSVSGEYIRLYAGGIAGVNSGSNAIVSNVEGTVSNTSINMRLDTLIAGVVGINRVNSNIENAVGRVVNINAHLIDVGHDMYRISAVIGGVNGENYGTIKNVIGSVDKVKVNSEQQNVYIGGVLAVNASTSESENYVDSESGGLLENAITLKLDAEILNYEKSYIMYGDVVGFTEVVDLENTCGAFNVYMLSTSTINITPNTLENPSPIHEIKELELANQVDVDTLTSTLFSVDLAFDSTIWNIVDGEIATLLMLEEIEIWMGEMNNEEN